MKIKQKLIVEYITLFVLLVLPQTGFPQSKIPHLAKNGNVTQLIVHGQPFLILGGETGNSSGSDIRHMRSVWPKAKAMHLNTVLVPVYWELIEQEEGNFDFSLVDQIIEDARKNDLKLIFLWFASWKNSMSCYVPPWIKTNQERFPRAMDDKGRGQEILTPFSENNLQADMKAFEELMKHLKTTDGNDHTVIMIQVENEIGMLPVARDYYPLANEQFIQDVPGELTRYLKENKENLVPEFHEVWANNGFKTSGNWEKIFGKGPHTDEIFMAWHFAKYINRIIEAGKAIYPLPMFVNAALNRPGRQPGKGYPSAGPLPHVMDVWKAAGPSIDFLAPDFYTTRFRHWCNLYTRQGDPLFIPEHRFDNTAAAKAVYVIGHYEAMGFSPFSFETAGDDEQESLGNMYALLSRMTQIIVDHQGLNKTEGILFDKENQETVLYFGNYAFTCRHDYTLGWSPDAGRDEWPMSGAIIIQTREGKFLIAGSGVVITFEPLNNNKLNAGILTAEEGNFVGETWTSVRRMNGDQTHQGRHIRIPIGNYSIQKFELYTYR